MSKPIHLPRALVCAVFLLHLTAALSAQEGELVVEVEINGTAHVSEERIRSNLKTRAGTVFSEETLSEDIKTLYENEDFRILAVRSDRIAVPGGVKVILYVKPDDRITGHRFIGVVGEDVEDLTRLLGLRDESIISPYVLASYADRIRDYYRNKGYYLAEINVWLEPDESGMQAVFEVFEGEKVTVSEITFVGNEKLDEGTLKKRMDLSTPTLWIFTSKLKADVLQQDIVALNEFARRDGYLDARISLEEVRIEGDSDEAEIVIRVQEGERFAVGDIAVRFCKFENNERVPIESLESSAEEILDMIEIESGDFFRQARIDRDIVKIEKFYGERGYIRAKVFDPAELYAEEEPVVHLTFWVYEDHKKKVRDVIVLGNTLTKDKVIRREVTLNPGDIFRRDEMNWTKSQLNALQFFVNRQGQPRVLAVNQETEDPEYEDFVIEVEEGKTGFFFFTLGASTDGGLFGGGRIAKRNFDLTDGPSSPWAAPVEFFTHDAFHGGGQTLQLSAMPGTVYSSYDLNFHEPYFFDSQPNPISFSLNAYHRATDYDEYDVTRTGLAPAFGKRLSREWSVSLGLRNEQIKMRNVSNNAPLEAKQLEGATGRRSVETSVRYHKVDDPFDPKKGVSTGLSYEYTGGVLGNDLEMNRIYSNSTVHVPLFETATGKVHKLIFRGNVGWEHEQGDMDDIPIFERFFVGGSSGRFPIRGFKWREVGPRIGDDPIGGEFAYSLSAEYMIPLYSHYDAYYDVETPIFRGVFFVDAGGIASDIHAGEEIRELRSSYGVGLRITLPVFQGLPIALDYGIPFKKYEGDDRRSFSFNIQNWF